MFITNQKGDVCTKLESLSWDLVWDDEVNMTLIAIHNRISDKIYNFGSTEQCNNAIQREQANYISANKCQKVLAIYVNKNRFAIFKDVEEGKRIFRRILDAIKHSEELFEF